MIQGSMLLDCEGLSLLLAKDERMHGRLTKAQGDGFQAVISVVTLLEAHRRGIDRQWRDFVLSRLHIEPVTQELTMLAVELLERTSLAGHTCAIDAVVAATALRQPRPVVLYTSDVGDMSRLCEEPDRAKDERVRIIKI